MTYTKENIIDMLKTVFDPEIPVNVWDLGLIYNIDITDTSDVKIKMTLTSPTCPMAEEIIQMVRFAVGSIVAPAAVSVELVWDPIWSLDKMTPSARLELDLTEEGW